MQLGLALGGGGLTEYHPVYDYLGNLTALVRPNGDLVERYDYTPYGGRIVTGNDNQAPQLEQIRLDDGVIRLQLSEPSVKAPQLSILAIQNLSRGEQPILSLQAVNSAGRQFARQIAFKNGGDPAEDPPTWPEPGEHVKLVVAAGSFEDQFGNISAVYTYADLVWPGANGILVDNIKPRIEEICAQGNQLKVTFSEKVSPSLAESVFEVDSDGISWESENEGYTLKTELATGPHSLSFATSPLDLAGLGFAAAGSQSFTTSGIVKSIYSAPFPGEAGDSLVGNPYGFQGLPLDGETGFLYVRNRYYDPELGRFITPDPQGYGDGPNLYQFGLNNPIVNRDPTGEAVQVIPCAIAGAAGVAAGWGINKLLGEKYDSTDAAIDFGIGAFTCGIGNAIGLATKLSPLARFALNAGADASITVAGEATRSLIHGDEITAGGLLRSGALSVGVGHILPYALKFGRNVKPVEAMLDSAGPKIGTFSADGRMVGDGPGATLAGAPGAKMDGIILGEFMERVRIAGKVTGLRYWSAKNWDVWRSAGVEYKKNRRWLLDQINSGVPIYSLGKTPGFARGPYYRAEVALLLEKGYRRRFYREIDLSTYTAGKPHSFKKVNLYEWEGM